MDRELLKQMALHQKWADAAHWKMLHENPTLMEDEQIRTRLNHMLAACRMLTTLARGGTPDMAPAPVDDLEPAMSAATDELLAAIDSVDPATTISLPRGPKGPFEAPAGVILLQAVMHSQHHRGQNAARMTALGVKPPMTDFILWHAFGRP